MNREAITQRMRSSCTSCLTKIMAESKDDVKSLKFWRAVVAEFIGCLFYVIITCGACVETEREEHPMVVRIALASGFSYAIILYFLRSVSGGHGNPAVSMAMLVTRRISVARGLLYALSQTLGAMLGAAILYGLTAFIYRDALGSSLLGKSITEGQGFGVEFFCTCFLVLVIFACYEKSPRLDDVTAPVIIGLTLTAVSLFAVPYTGASFNPARSFGPAVVMATWHEHWVFWFGPILGAIVGGVMYDIFFGKDASFSKLSACALVFRKRDKPRDEKLPQNSSTPSERLSLRNDRIASVEDLDDVIIVDDTIETRLSGSGQVNEAISPVSVSDV